MINTDVLAAYTLYPFKHLTTSRTFHNHAVLLTEITIYQFLHKECNCRFFSKFLLDVLVEVVGSSCIHTGSFLSLLPFQDQPNRIRLSRHIQEAPQTLSSSGAAELSDKGARRALVLR